MPVEILAIASAVCALCQGIQTWLELQEEKVDTVVRIGSVIQQVHNILLPFSTVAHHRSGEQQLVESIRCAGDVLQRTKDHLLAWSTKRSQKIVAFLAPNTLIKQLKEDEQQLSNQLIILLTSVAVVGYMKDHSKHTSDWPKPVMDSGPGSSSRPPPYDFLECVKQSDGKAFWNDYIGGKVQFIERDHFMERLSMWAKGNISKSICERIIMRLDEYNVGGVSVSNFGRVLGPNSFKVFIETCIKGHKFPPVSSIDVHVAPGQSLHTPLLVWVDDNHDNNNYEVAQAKGMGIQVVQLNSTAMAKSWIEANFAFLRDNDEPSRLRFISDNARNEMDPRLGETLNVAAGESFLRFLRGRFFNAPVLIYTGLGVDLTRYVEAYSAAGSTTSARVCMKFISGMVVGKGDDFNWQGFSVR
ncbi:hypothetical protein CPB83DRAFT_862010 [Crepidotus variabilis]|uniref:Uncharacterized protein n=1 Tax=Crepidotus variabilis TaxID=179855 RepID=A0A9P6E7H0_9AGAR|nr:hypothetical protein CPB83DRAFT_862010 [Crepidotus variabilis]